jgi:flavorubredoxin
VADPAKALVPEKLYALGGTVPLDGRVSWFPRDARGLAPLQCYLLVEDGSALLIDTGLPVHRDTMLHQLHDLLAPGASFSILHTRIAEYDSVGNTAAICCAFPVERLYAHFPTNLMAHISGAPAPRRGSEELVPRIGDSLTVGSAGGRELILLGAPLRLLLTFWAYDTETRTLFTSDSFGHVPLLGDGTDPASVRDQVFAKFDWLARADRRPIVKDLDDLFDSYEVETIAPMHGQVLSGRDTVARHRDMVTQALEAG